MKTALVIGAGPAGLMAADVLADAGVAVTLCDAKPSFGRKFLMAGKSGLNLTKDEAIEPLLQHYSEASVPLRPMIEDFDTQAVQDWARGLGQEIFTGSSGRVFPRAMKASPLLRAWLVRLTSLGVTQNKAWKWVGWQDGACLFATPSGPQILRADVTILALGGGSWARLGSDGAWASLVRDAGSSVRDFAPSNAAVSVEWSPHMTPHLGAALKSMAWRAGDLSSRGEATLSQRGLEGGGVYTLTPALRAGAALYADLAPDHAAEKLQLDLAGKSQKLRLSHWLRNSLRLPPAKIALFFEMVAGDPPDRGRWVETLKALPIKHAGLRPIDEAISTAGGVPFEAMTDQLMLRALPGVFCAGEMLDWEAPTGGYLMTACFATGQWAARGACAYLDAAARNAGRSRIAFA